MSFADLVAKEVARARKKHGPMKSHHEAVAVIEEEFIEFRESVFWPPKGQFTDDCAAQELVQLAAMCQRAFEDLKMGGDL